MHIYEDDQGFLWQDELHGGDCKRTTISCSGSGSVVSETVDQSYWQVKGLTEVTARDKQHEGKTQMVINAFQASSKYENFKPTTATPLQPNTILWLNSDGTHKTIDGGEFLLILRKCGGKPEAAFQMVCGFMHKRNQAWYRARLLAELDNGTWLANGGKFSDGFRHLPPCDNSNGTLLYIPGNVGKPHESANSKPFQKTADTKPHIAAQRRKWYEFWKR